GQALARGTAPVRTGPGAPRRVHVGACGCGPSADNAAAPTTGLRGAAVLRGPDDRADRGRAGAGHRHREAVPARGQPAAGCRAAAGRRTGMNIEDLLRADAHRHTGNPLEPHLGGLVQRVRRRRRRRAGAQVAGVVIAVAAGLVVWQVGGPWDRPVPPPATDPPDEQWCGQPLEEVAGNVTHADLGVAELESTDEQLTVSVTISSETDLELSPLVDVLFTDPDTGEVVGYSEDDRAADREDANLFVPAGGEAETG